LKLPFTLCASNKSDYVERALQPMGELGDDQRARLAEIAERTPVTLELKNGLTIKTILAPAHQALNSL